VDAPVAEQRLALLDSLNIGLLVKDVIQQMREAGRLAVAAWSGYGVAANNYSVRLTGNLVRCFANAQE